MIWLSNLKIGGKLALSFAVMLIMIAGLGGFALVELSKVNEEATVLAGDWLPSVRSVLEMSMRRAELRAREFRHIVADDDATRAELDKGMTEDIAKFESLHSAYEKLISSPEDRRLFDSVLATWKAYLDAHEKAMALSRRNKDEEAKALVLGEAAQQYHELKQKFDAMVALNHKGEDESAAAANRIYGSVRLT